MTEANSEDFLVQGIQFLQEEEEVTDPSVISVCVAAAPGDDEAVVDSDVIVVGKLAVGDPIRVPRLPFLPQHSDENPKIPSVLLLHVLRVLRA